MNYHRYSEDWITHLTGEYRSEALRVLRSLSLEKLQKFPPPKIGGLPVGNETRVLKRYVKGESSQLDASALSSVYRMFASPREKLLNQAFRETKHLSRESWIEVLGDEATFQKWGENNLLRKTKENNFVCRFCIVALGDLIFAVDPLNDHGNPHESVIIPKEELPEVLDEDIKEFNHTYIGLDSLRMIEIMEENSFPAHGRYLDCGQGAGAILLYFARKFDEAIGIEINIRSTKLADFNIELNQLKNCSVYQDNALELKDKYGKFDLISWNLPFIFAPSKYKDEAIDSYGGEMGIGLCLDFIKTVPGILQENGVACIAALSPILNNGDNVLEKRLGEILPQLKLDCSVVIAQISLAHSRELWDFHQSHGIRKFESVYLYLTNGQGIIKRVEAPATRIALDAIREKMYQRKFA